MIRRRKTVRFATRNVTLVRAATESLDLWCEACGVTVAMVTPGRAAEISMTTPREIYRQVERGAVHFVEAGGGEVLICSESLRGYTAG